MGCDRGLVGSQKADNATTGLYPKASLPTLSEVQNQLPNAGQMPPGPLFNIGKALAGGTAPTRAATGRGSQARS